MTHRIKVGSVVQVLVSDPWEFGTECGVGPFAGNIADIDKEMLLITLETPISCQGSKLYSIVAQARHAPASLERLAEGKRLEANLFMLRSRMTNASELSDEVKTGGVPALGSIELT